MEANEMKVLLEKTEKYTISVGHIRIWVKRSELGQLSEDLKTAQINSFRVEENEQESDIVTVVV